MDAEELPDMGHETKFEKTVLVRKSISCMKGNIKKIKDESAAAEEDKILGSALTNSS
jgi:hypothetical protein